MHSAEMWGRGKTFNHTQYSHAHPVYSGLKVAPRTKPEPCTDKECARTIDLLIAFIYNMKKSRLAGITEIGVGSTSTSAPAGRLYQHEETTDHLLAGCVLVRMVCCDVRASKTPRKSNLDGCLKRDSNARAVQRLSYPAQI